MKEIKFRAWNTNVNEMLHFNSPIGIADDEHRYGIFLPCQEGKMYIGGEYKIMQYTGLKDKNGIEIYEGDIVRITGNYFKKSIQEDMIVEYDESRAWFGVIDTLHTVSLNTFDYENHVEVISNIYERRE